MKDLIKELRTNIQKFIDEQIEYCNNFVNNPDEFIKKMIQFMDEGKNHFDLAKELNLQQNLVKFLIKIIQENHKDLVKDGVLLFCDFSKLNYDAFINKAEPSAGIGIEIYPNDTLNWNWHGASFIAIYPVCDTDFVPKKLMSAFSESWDFYFRPPSKIYCSPKTEEEKQEVLQMTYLINKWLWEI